MTTDSYVLDPFFFPGGNIGILAVRGKVNDLSMQVHTPDLPSKEIKTLVALAGLPVYLDLTKVVGLSK